jgi:hypothetical protein
VGNSALDAEAVDAVAAAAAATAQWKRALRRNMGLTFHTHSLQRHSKPDDVYPEKKKVLMTTGTGARLGGIFFLDGGMVDAYNSKTRTEQCGFCQKPR